MKHSIILRVRRLVYTRFLQKHKHTKYVVIVLILVAISLAVATSIWIKNTNSPVAADKNAVATAKLNETITKISFSISSTDKPPEIHAAYIKLLNEARDYCSNIDKTDTEAFSEAYKATLADTEKLCVDLDNVTRYSLNSYTALEPYLQISESDLGDPSKREQNLQQIKITLSNFNTVSNDLDYPGHNEVKVELANAVEVANQNAPDRQKVLIMHQRNLLNQRTYYWTNFIGLDQLQASVQQQLDSYCELVKYCP